MVAAGKNEAYQAGKSLKIKANLAGKKLIETSAVTGIEALKDPPGYPHPTPARCCEDR